MSTTIKVCPVCSVSWYADKPEKHMMTCTAAAASALDRLKEAAKSDAWHKTVAVKDLALVLAVAEANQRTPGTYETCSVSDCYRRPDNFNLNGCKWETLPDDCPLRTAKDAT